MASPFLLAQNIFTALTDQPRACHNATALNGTIAQDQIGPSFPTDISSLITFLLSLSALGDWFKLIALGSVLETSRRLAFHFYYKLYNSFFIKATFEEGDSSYGAQKNFLHHTVLISFQIGLWFGFQTNLPGVSFISRRSDLRC